MDEVRLSVIHLATKTNINCICGAKHPINEILVVRANVTNIVISKWNKICFEVGVLQFFLISSHEKSLTDAQIMLIDSERTFDRRVF
jgi:hypothetical protein